MKAIIHDQNNRVATMFHLYY